MAKDLDQELETALGATDGDAGDEAALAREVSAPLKPKKPKKSNIALLVGLLAMTGGVAALFLVGFKEAAVYAMPVDEVVQKSSTLNGKRLRVDGELVPGTLEKRSDGCEYRFRMKPVDQQATSKVELPIRFSKCVIPDTFRDQPEGGVMVTVEGELIENGTLLEATTVMAKCASKYDPATHEMVLSDGTRVQATSVPEGYGAAPKK